MDRKSLLRLVLFALAVQIVYAVGLGHTPAHLHRDEVDIALQAQSIATSGRDLDGRLLPLYFRMHNLGPNVWFHPLIVYVTAVFLWFLPFTEAALRFPTTVIATLDVVLMYFVARRLFGTERWAFVAAALLAMTPAHVLHGRLLFDFIYPLPFVLAWLLFLLKYLDHGRPWLLFASTTALGVGVFSYIASVIMMPVYLAHDGAGADRATAHVDSHWRDGRRGVSLAVAVVDSLAGNAADVCGGGPQSLWRDRRSRIHSDRAGGLVNRGARAFGRQPSPFFESDRARDALLGVL